MAIFNFNVLQSTFNLDLKSEVSTDCATYFQYEVLADDGDVLQISLSGTSTVPVTWTSQSYLVGSTVFNDWINETTKTLIYSNNGLRLIFSLENSGIAGFFNGAELTVVNVTQSSTRKVTGIRYIDGPSCNVPTSEITGDKHFTHTQALPSLIWSITHNLEKMTSVTIQDDSGNTVLGEINYTSIDTITITFISAVSGVAYLN